MSTRREFLARAAAVAGVSAAAPVQVAAGGAKAKPGSGASPSIAELLVSYFSRACRSLLQPASGIFRYPNIFLSMPGSVYSTSLWCDDLYWTTSGLLELARLRKDRSLHQAVCLHAQGSLFNFLDHQSEDGRLAIIMTETDPDVVGHLLGQGVEPNQALPVFGQLALLLSNALQDVKWFESRFERLLRFHNSWSTRYQSSIGLLTWANGIWIFVDNDPSAWGRPPHSSAHLFLNCFYYKDLLASAELARRLGRAEDETTLRARAVELGARIQKYCWDPRDKFFYTVDVQCADLRNEVIPTIDRGMPMSWQCLPIRVQMFTGFLPMWCGLADSGQAAELVNRHYLNEHTFYAPHGVRSLSAQETMYSNVYSLNPSDWLGPVWGLSNYLVWKGLKAYRFEKEAADLAQKTLHLFSSDIVSSGTVNEYYHPDTGAPLGNRGYLSWNLMALEML